MENTKININKINYYLYFIIFFLLVSLDRITKLIALNFNFNYLTPFQRLFHLPPIKNNGISLHLFNMSHQGLFLLLKAIGIIVILYFLYRFKNKYEKNQTAIGELLVISGGISNLIDRFYYDSVIDFIFIKIPLINYLAIGNIADIIITIGCILLILELFSEQD